MRRKIISTMIVILTIGTFTGCGFKNETKDLDVTLETAEAETEESEQVPEDDPDEADDIATATDTQQKDEDENIAESEDVADISEAEAGSEAEEDSTAKTDFEDDEQEEAATAVEVTDTEEEEGLEQTTDNTASATGNFSYSFYCKFDGVTYTVSAPVSKPTAGVTVTWSGVATDCCNAECTMDASGGINYDTDKGDLTTSYTMNSEDEKYGVVLWINASECGFDQVIFWYPDGTYRLEVPGN